jgi:uncharacterized protein DUF4349
MAMACGLRAARGRALWTTGLLVFARGCGAASSADKGGAASPALMEARAMAAPTMETLSARQALAMAPAPPPAAGTAPVPRAVADAPHSAAMLIYTANLSLAVYQVEPQLDAVERIARELGGYLATRQDTAITVRVPRDRFDEAVARIEQQGDVLHRDIKARDVTDEYVDLEARLKNDFAMRDRLTQLLQRAAVKEALDIEKELGRVTEEIERLEGKLKLLRDQIAFSTITVIFAPLEQQTVHDTSLLAPFPWLQDLGLQSLLNVRP